MNTLELDTLSFLAIFALVTLASRQVGTVFARAKLPLITGFLFTGVATGPYGLHVIAAEAVEKLRFIDELSLAFIAFAAGSELVVRQIRSRFKSIRYTTVALVLSTFSIGSLAFFLISAWIPFASTMAFSHRASVAILAGAILVARSPSSAIAVVNEVRAKGPFTKTALGVTVIMDVAVITLFSICATIAGTVFSGRAFDFGFILILVSELALSVGAGYLLDRWLRTILNFPLYRNGKTILILASGFGVFLLSEELRHLSEATLPFQILLEPMLICMVAGFLTANYSPYRTELMKALKDVAPFVYVAFFTLTGASLRLDVLAASWLVALGLFAVRLVAIFIGSFSGGMLAGEPMRKNRIAWMCYITQAGVGLGLAKEVAVEFPEWGGVFATIAISVIVLNQVVGPPLFKWALFLVKEARPRSDTPTADDVRDAVIFGLDGESLALARLLQSNHWEVKIVTNRIQYVREMGDDSEIEIQTLPNLDLPALNRLGVGRADSVVAMLSDEENYAVCELVHQHFGLRNFIVRLNHRANFKRFHDLGALVVEPSTAIVNLLDQFVRSPSAARLLLGLEQGRKLIEFELRNTDLQAVPVRELHLPLDLHILSIRRRGQEIVTGGFTRLQLGDWLTVVGSQSSLEQMMLQFGESRNDALVHMVGRVTSKQLASSSASMEKEVTEILQTPDVARRIRFEGLIQESHVLDLDSPMSFDVFFRRAAERISSSAAVAVEELYRLLVEREREMSTALRPDLAIPHIVIEGENSFHILLARCKDGIHFSELAPRVQAVFVLAGTRDQRDYHLYVLSAIAEIVQQRHFRERWLRAGSETALRNIAMMSKKGHKK